MDSQPALIEYRGVCLSFGPERLYQDFDLRLEAVADGRPSILALLGRSGAGKSTLLRLAAGLQLPDAGQVLLWGKPRGPDDRLSMVFQQYSSFPWKTVLQNVELGLEFRGFPREERRGKALAILEAVGLAEHAHTFAKLGNLSGGQMQRVAIARSLVGQHPLVLLDEPFGALDVRARLDMQRLLLGLSRSQPSHFVLVTHSVSEAVFLADRILLLGGRPAQVVQRVEVDWPERVPELKRSEAFATLVADLEERLMEL